MYRIQSERRGRPRVADRPRSKPNARNSLRRGTGLSADVLTAARAFYGRALRGRRVRPDIPGTAPAFIVGDTIVEMRPDLGAAAPTILLLVEDPDALAQRCWDAGFTVRVGQDVTGRAPVSVIDPFGRRLDLAPAIGLTSPARAAAQEAS